jgi:hypothetical protein
MKIYLAVWTGDAGQDVDVFEDEAEWRASLLARIQKNSNQTFASLKQALDWYEDEGEREMDMLDVHRLDIESSAERVIEGIRSVLDGKEWGAESLDAIAEILRVHFRDFPNAIRDVESS